MISRPGRFRSGAPKCPRIVICRQFSPGPRSQRPDARRPSYAPPTTTIRDGTPQAQFVKGAALCDKQAEADEKVMGHGPLDPTHSTYNRMFDACMRASGFVRKPPK